MHKLLIEDDEGKTVAVPLIREEITIGRLEGNTIRLTEQNVSRRHARLLLRDKQLKVEDLGSYNGTKLNGNPLTGPALLKDGDVILIGDYRLGIKEDAQAAPPPNPAVAPLPVPGPGPLLASPVAEMMEGQPTIPVSTMMAQMAASEIKARLVVTGRVLSGQEFSLDRPSQVIGRTSENDIILNHKSISRHHAKILREGKRFVIVDLESANGIRVGGAEHERTELDPGDLIELGEVKLRFIVGDGPVSPDGAGFLGDKRKVFALIAGGGVALVLIAVFALSGGKKQPLIATPPPPPAPPTAPPPPAPPAISLERLLAQAQAAAQVEKWAEALGMVSQATAQAPGSTEAAVLRKAIEAEKEASEKIATLATALENQAYDEVMAGVQAIPEDSRYHDRALSLKEEATAGYLAAHLEAAKNFLASDACTEAEQEARLVLALDPEQKKAALVLKRCAKRLAMAEQPAPPRPARKAEPKVAVKKAPAAPNPPAPEAAADPDRLIKEAQQAWFRGQYAVAIDSARKALKAKPGLANAYQIIAVCSCALKDAGSAAKAFDKLDDRNKQYVRASCQKSGINL
jgi:pSer/pThr/pTyr-binding forkhead associated (FHA) protein